MKIFGFSGLGADQRVFKDLSLNHELIPIDWIAPLKHEGIESYSERLIQKHNLKQEISIGILGVSFGGLIAIEISKRLNPQQTILISSIEIQSELGFIPKLIGKSKITTLLPKQAFHPPKKIAHFLFGTQNKELLNSILDDTDLTFAKWAINELLCWKNNTQVTNLLTIAGTHDKLLPPKGNNAILIEKGEHFMIVDRAKEISKVINEHLK